MGCVNILAMKLICTAVVNNRLLPSLSLSNQSKPFRCQLAVGRKPGSGIWLTISSNLKTAFDSAKVVECGH
jgi:hypothetical protein